MGVSGAEFSDASGVVAVLVVGGVVVEGEGNAVRLVKRLLLLLHQLKSSRRSHVKPSRVSRRTLRCPRCRH